MKLTKPQRVCLNDLANFGGNWASLRGSGHPGQTKDALCRAGLLERNVSLAGNEYHRITEAGRAALAGKEG